MIKVVLLAIAPVVPTFTVHVVLDAKFFVHFFLEVLGLEFRNLSLGS